MRLQIFLIFLSITCLSKSIIATSIPQAILDTVTHSIVFPEYPITSLYVDSGVNWNGSWGTNPAPTSSRRYVLLGKSPENGTPVSKIIASTLQKAIWEDGIYIYPYLVDENNNLITNPTTLSAKKRANLLVAIYDKNLNLLTNDQVSQNNKPQPVYFGNKPIDYKLESFLIGFNNKTWYWLRYGTLLFVKAGKTTPLTKPIAYQSTNIENIQSGSAAFSSVYS